MGWGRTPKIWITMRMRIRIRIRMWKKIRIRTTRNIKKIRINLPHEKVEGRGNERDWVEAGVNSQVWPDDRLVMVAIMIIQ